MFLRDKYFIIYTSFNMYRKNCLPTLHKRIIFREGLYRNHVDSASGTTTTEPIQGKISRALFFNPKTALRLQNVRLFLTFSQNYLMKWWVTDICFDFYDVDNRQISRKQTRGFVETYRSDTKGQNFRKKIELNFWESFAREKAE